MNEEEKIEIRDLRAKERFFLDDEFFNGYVRILGTNALGVYCSLCRHANKEQKAWPSQKKIAEELNLSVPTVNEWIKVLEYFRIIKKSRTGKQLVNRYYLLDKRIWRKDWEVILNDLNSPDFKLFKVTTKTVLNHDLNSLTSILRKHNIKDTHKKDQNESEIFFQKYIPLDPLLRAVSVEEIQRTLKDVGFDEFYI
ncbi:MAG: helix-turn-helix domain-containing protein, partial [Deltaproteobacteria bacterium]|nr:helix-turn-helix domain-containing protein [Deltaproteobacteria bacterium]